MELDEIESNLHSLFLDSFNCLKNNDFNLQT
jgi:hypothetical protein